MKQRVILVIIAGALGYFVDIYDLLLFSIVRSESLNELGVVADKATIGLSLLNWQLFGLAIGGIFWGIVGDKNGRVKILFGSIILYSVANLLNAFVIDVNQYKVLRFVAGLGLAGELGAGVTLVSEYMAPKKRGYGTMIIASVGCIGVVAAILINRNFGWRNSYIIGGVIGILILIFRFSITESDMFKEAKVINKKHRGNIFKLIHSPKLLSAYIKCILIGAPTYFVISILMTLAPEFGGYFGLKGISAGTAILFFYFANALSDILCPLVSNQIESRKKALYIFISITLLGILVFLFQHPGSNNSFYLVYTLLGLGVGFWSTLLSYIAEQFGTNLRATATTSIPNFIRALGIPVAWLFHYLYTKMNLINSALIVGLICIFVSLISIYLSKETFGKNINYND